MPSAHSGATSAGVSSCVGTVDSKWRNRDEFFEGRDAIKAFLTRKWQKELQYKLMKELWCYQYLCALSMSTMITVANGGGHMEMRCVQCCRKN